MFKRSVLWGALCALTASPAFAQTTPTVDSLVASARTYAGADHGGTFKAVCVPPPATGAQVVATVNPADYPTNIVPTPPGETNPRVNWYAPPAQIADNLYWLGTRNHSTYALVNKAGETILIDGNFAYATEDEIHNGLKYLGLKLDKVKYSIYAHAHGDHDGGAHLTEAAAPNATIIYGEGDWLSVLARTGPHATRYGPQNDGTDGRVITSRDTSLKIVTYPGHTPGTISFLFEYMDGGKPVKAAYVGGTLFSFTGMPRSTTSTSPRSRSSPRRQRSSAPKRCSRITTSTTSPSTGRTRRRTFVATAVKCGRRTVIRRIHTTSVNGGR